MKGKMITARLSEEDFRRLHEAFAPFGGISKWILVMLDGRLVYTETTEPSLVVYTKDKGVYTKPIIKSKTDAINAVANLQRPTHHPTCSCFVCKGN
jgi:hypothetical protein